MAVRAFFNFLAPKTAAPVADPRRDELAEELISICEPTDAGAKAAPAIKEQIEELVGRLLRCAHAGRAWGSRGGLQASHCMWPRHVRGMGGRRGRV